MAAPGPQAQWSTVWRLKGLRHYFGGKAEGLVLKCHGQEKFYSKVMILWEWLESWRNLGRTKTHRLIWAGSKKARVFRPNLFLKGEPTSETSRTTCSLYFAFSALSLFHFPRDWLWGGCPPWPSSCFPLCGDFRADSTPPIHYCICASQTSSSPTHEKGCREQEICGWDLRTAISIWICIYSNFNIVCKSQAT